MGVALCYTWNSNIEYITRSDVVMAGFLQSLIAAVVVLIGGFAGAGIILRYCVKKRLDVYFSRLEASLALNQRAAEQQLVNECAVYPALSELIYRAKTSCDRVKDTRELRYIGRNDLYEACGALTAQLWKYRIYLPPDLFKQIHEFKRVVQDINVLVDTLTRRKEGIDCTAAVPEEAAQSIIQKSQLVTILCDAIIPELRKCMLALRGPLSS